jgi:capsular polysaccharide transport system permease protein
VRLAALLRRAPAFEQPLTGTVGSSAVAPSDTRVVPVRSVAGGALAPYVRPSLPHVDARPGKRSQPSPILLSFIAVVLVPVVVVAVYLFVIAADQYVSEFRFSLNSVDPPRLDPLSLLTGNASHSPAGSESQIVVQYITSRAIIDKLDPSLDLRRMFSPPDADWWARLPRPTSIEALVRYWRGQVDPFYDPANGTVVVRVRAFTPAEALQLAKAIVAA